jgi:type VI secretion system protein ImpC
MSGEQQQDQQAASTESVGGGLLDQAISATKQTKKEDAKELIQALVSEAMSGTVTYDKNIISTIKERIAAIDQVVSKQLSAIMHHPKFQKLEGSWRGLNYFVFNSETGTQLKLRVLNCSKRDLYKDLSSADEFDQSTIWKAIYENEFGMPGGEPYATLVGDYEFENHPEDIALLEGMSGVAAASMAPFVTTPSAKLFGLESWEELSQVRDLKTGFDGKEYIKWKSFRESADSRYVVMTMPRTLARLPYGANTKPVDEFDFEEVETGPNGESIAVSHDQYCWMSTAYVMAARLTAAFSETSWCTAIRGANSGGKVEGLPTHIFKSDDGDTDVKCPTEIAITDRREKELSDLGFMPLSHYKNTDYSVFFGGQTTQKPKIYDKPAATENAAISARLPYIMAASRIGHFLKVMARDNIGSFKEAHDVEKWLNEWIMQYVAAEDSPTEETKARRPLREAKITVAEIPGSPGSYNAVAHLRPFLQMEELNASVRMVTKLPQQV